MQCRGAKSFVDDLGLSRGVVFSRAVALLRSIETKPPDSMICPLWTGISSAHGLVSFRCRPSAAGIGSRRLSSRSPQSPEAFRLTLFFSAMSTSDGRGLALMAPKRCPGPSVRTPDCVPGIASDLIGPSRENKFGVYHGGGLGGDPRPTREAHSPIRHSDHRPTLATAPRRGCR